MNNLGLSSEYWRDNPMLDKSGAQRLKAIIDHPCAPHFHNHSGSRLTQADLKELHHFAEQSKQDHKGQSWLKDFLKDALKHTVYYRQLGIASLQLQDYPSIGRQHLADDITQFVPEHLPLNRLITYETSGTTGQALKIPSHPQVAARYSIFHKRALASHGVDSERFTSDTACMLVGYQKHCFTYASISPYLNHKGLIKLNLYPADWRQAKDREAYIDAMKPDVITGDPVSLAELAKLNMTHTPQALLSTSMALNSGQRAYLESRFHCPVVDIYSLNEVGPVAVYRQSDDTFIPLQDRLIIEILDENDQAVAPGQRGEITVTGGFNDYLPLIRYRTGDYAASKMIRGQMALYSLAGRPPVKYLKRDGGWVNNVDMTHLLAPLSPPQFSLIQGVDKQLKLMVYDASALACGSAMAHLVSQFLGYPCQLSHLPVPPSGQKIIQYQSELSM